MKNLARLILVSILMMFATSSWAEVVQLYNCEQHDDVDTEPILTISSKWLKAAITVKGGENLRVWVRHPVAAATDDIDFVLAIGTPNFTEWGVFTDHYEGSTASEIDDEFDEMADCADSTLWEGEEIK